jgi:hypothetical protein
MRCLAALAAPAQRHLAGVAFGVFVLLLASMYLLRLRPLADVVAAAIALVAVMALLARAEPWPFRRAMLGWLAGAGGLLAAGALVSPAVRLGEAWQGVHSLVMLAAFLLFARALLRTQEAERLLAMIFVAGVACATLSVALHVVTAPSLLERIALLGRPGNPIPAAGAMAVAALAGLALLRGGALPRGWRVPAMAGIGAILVAMLFTQSRGPLLGVALGGALLLVPAARAVRLGLLVPPVAFLLASSIVPLEATLRALFCGMDETLACRPSLRLPLWLSSLELIGAHPLFGLGMQHQMGEGWLNNPQNAALALGVYFGLPFLLLSVVALGLLLRRLAGAEPGLMVHWAAAMMAFSSVYFAFEPNPYAFYNAHWMFFWLPVAVILMAAPHVEASGLRAA